MRVVGLMSGTSADGIDAALVEIKEGEGGLSLETLAYVSTSYDTKTREAIFELFGPPSSTVDKICRIPSK